MKKILLIAITLLLPLVLFAQTADECLKYGRNFYYGQNGVAQDYTEAAKWFLKAAEQGNADAQTFLGYSYENGLGVTKDFIEAVKWYRKAAEQGYSVAQYNLGNSYYNGSGVAKDYTEAAKWYRKAADQGFSLAQSSLGDSYYNGSGVAKDYTEAAKWFLKAAEQGNADAQTFLGYSYENGLGVTKDYNEAVKWYRKAAEQGNSSAQYNLANFYYNGSGVAKDINEAVKWLRKAAEQGYSEAQKDLGLCYEHGVGVEKDYKLAFEWYQKAAEQGLPEAQNDLGLCYEHGVGVEKDYKLAFEWYQKAAAQDNLNAMFAIGGFYEDGLGVTQDYLLAKEWYQKAADKGEINSQFSLASLYYYGRGVGKDYKMAMEWFQKAAAQGHLDAMLVIGAFYEEGVGVARDYQKAKEWYQKALNCDPNFTKAKTPLANIEKKIAEQSNDNNSITQNTTTSTQPKQQPVAQPQTKDGIDIVDKGIPVISRVNNNTFAIIIANEDYQTESKVEYAKNDGEVFKIYCHKTLGLPEKNVHFVANATRNNIIGELFWLSQVCKAFKGEASAIFYYAGHGLPDEDSGAAYLLPVDGNSQILPTCYSINELYETLGKLPAKKVTVLMDACFSGAKRNGGMLASARGVAIKAKASEPKGSMIVLSAAQGNETAYKYEEAKHGLFTYFLLKKLKDSNGNVTMGELSNYITEQVKRYSIVENGKSQTPTVQTSNNLRSTWESMKFD